MCYLLTTWTFCFIFVFFFNDTATTEIYTLSLHDALPIYLVLLIFERAKTGDIIQGLPRIEELLEARKPKEACVLAERPGNAQVVYGADETVEVKIVEDDGVMTEYPIAPGQPMIVSDGQQVSLAEPLTDGPLNPHQILEFFFKYHRETKGVHESAMISLQQVQTFLVNEVQSVYQSQGIDIADKHIEVIVRQMTSKARVKMAVILPCCQVSWLRFVS